MKYFVLFVLIFTPPVCIQSLPIEQNFSQMDKFNSDKEDKYPDHTLWEFLLDKYVDDSGYVDYSGVLKDKQILEGYLNILKDNQPDQDWPKNEKLAYYINLYNAHTVHLILVNYPTKSIKKISDPWDQKLIPLQNDSISLGDLEHKILRKMGEPRIHFAINCASASCPKLLNKAYLAENLDVQLHQAVKEFINSKRNQIRQNHLKLSKIFKWYKKDFPNGDIHSYIDNYTNIDISQNAKVDYLEDEWNLNGTW